MREPSALIFGVKALTFGSGLISRVVPKSRSLRNTCVYRVVAGTRLVALESNATHRPSALELSCPESAFPRPPRSFVLTTVVDRFEQGPPAVSSVTVTDALAV